MEQKHELSLSPSDESFKGTKSHQMFSDYEKYHNFVSNKIFFLGAPNKTSNIIEDMDRKLLAFNYFSSDIIEAAQARSFLEKMAITYLISKVFNLGNCERQSFALFMHILNEGHFKESLEIILINGKSILGQHRCVVADRDEKSNLNDLSTWQNATYLDTWNNEILSGKDLTSLTKEQFASKGLVSGKVELISIYKRQTKLAKHECFNLINYLTETKSNLTVSLLKIIKQNYPDDLKELLLSSDEHSLIEQIHTQISNDIAMYEAMVSNLLSNENSLEEQHVKTARLKVIESEKNNPIFNITTKKNHSFFKEAIRQGREIKSLDELTRALELHPANVANRLKRAAIYLEKQEYLKAYEDYSIVYKEYPANSEAANGIKKCNLFLKLDFSSQPIEPIAIKTIKNTMKDNKQQIQNEIEQMNAIRI